MSLDSARKAQIAPVTEFGWGGCWQCQHCLAVCPVGAISILGRRPENSLSTPAPVLDALMTTRRACRRYLDKNVAPEVLSGMLDTLQNLPTDSNKRRVEYTLLDDQEQTRRFHDLVYREMERQASKGTIPALLTLTTTDRWKDEKPLYSPACHCVPHRTSWSLIRPYPSPARTEGDTVPPDACRPGGTVSVFSLILPSPQTGPCPQRRPPPKARRCKSR
ncbi:MAG: nitroreductase family protein [Clostridiales bacterium]|nr:nitroreductase family protein [Clostridiales bacterium]